MLFLEGDDARLRGRQEPPLCPVVMAPLPFFPLTPGHLVPPCRSAGETYVRSSRSGRCCVVIRRLVRALSRRSLVHGLGLDISVEIEVRFRESNF